MHRWHSHLMHFILTWLPHNEHLLLGSEWTGKWPMLSKRIPRVELNAPIFLFLRKIGWSFIVVRGRTVMFIFNRWSATLTDETRWNFWLLNKCWTDYSSKINQMHLFFLWFRHLVGMSMVEQPTVYISSIQCPQKDTSIPFRATMASSVKRAISISNRSNPPIFLMYSFTTAGHGTLTYLCCFRSHLLIS